jgi:enolase
MGGSILGGNLKLQEFMVSLARPYSNQLRIVANVHQKLEKLLVEKYGTSAKNLGDECGFAPLLNTADEALTIIEEAMAKSGSAAAASGFYDSGTKLYEV